MWHRVASSENDNRPSATRAERSALSTSSICRLESAPESDCETFCVVWAATADNRTDFFPARRSTRRDGKTLFVTASDTNTPLVELANDHPGVSDPVYLRRR